MLLFFFYFPKKVAGENPKSSRINDSPAYYNTFSGFNRPKRLLVFINPVGGRKLGCKIYMEQVQPLFELANIKVDIIGE